MPTNTCLQVCFRAGEEPAGLSVKGHYPKEDGIFTCLLRAQAQGAQLDHE